ncbi:hypothetical protein OSB04_015588 [Centaurea solstitialis]|uniref:Uncharacterized protein n=1 Tax=Centaurea solstitialis TaxID=347529 RepID=A0AA38TJC3_9ASTR|nr:hypothetical protein OSB04_015588 [Centaurea solstitialis]
MGGSTGMTVAAVKPPADAGRDDVYVAAVPLTATRGPPQLLMSTAYSLRLSWDLQHFMVLSTSPLLPSQVLVFDFQPQEPESIYTALGVLSGKKIPGVLQMRKMKKLPKTKCWMVGSCNVDVVDAIHKFNNDWDTDLIVGQHDCRHYTNGTKIAVTLLKNHGDLDCQLGIMRVYFFFLINYLFCPMMIIATLFIRDIP